MPSTPARSPSSNTTPAATGTKPSKAGAVATWADERLGLATMAKKNLRKVFPDHWSFMLGEIALWSFVVLLPQRRLPHAVVHRRAWARSTTTAPTTSCAASTMSEAMASTLSISFDVRGGLLMRQMHHWAAMLFIASMMMHLLRVFFTGALPQAARAQLGHRLAAAAPRHRWRASPATRCPTTCSPAPASAPPTAS